MPEFAGGTSGMMKYISAHIVYPAVCKENSIAGKVFLKFVIDTDGSVTDATVIKSSGVELLDNEALRVVRSMPAWTPGKQNGRTVKTYYNLPINFKLDDSAPILYLKTANTSAIYKEACSLLLSGQTASAIDKLATANSDYNCWFMLAVLKYNDNRKDEAKSYFIKTKNSITDETDLYFGLTKKYLEKYFGQQ